MPSTVAEITPDEVEGSILERFRRQVRAHGRRRAVKTDRFDLTYLDLDRLANRVAHAILDRLGPAPEPVGVLLEHDAPLIVALVAVLKAGKFYVPLDPAYPAQRTRAMVGECEPRLILADSTNHPTARAVAGDGCLILDIDALADGLPEDDPGITVGPDAFAYLLFTSGSTGVPKGIVENHRNVLQFTRTFTQQHRHTAEDRIVLLTSACFSGSAAAIYSSLLNGAALYMRDLRATGTADLADWVEREEITVFVGIAFSQMVRSLRAGRGFPHLRLVRYGGATLYRRDVELFQRYLPDHCVLVNALGTTEKKILTSYVLDRTTKVDGPLVPVGYPVEDVEISLLDEHGLAVPVGAVGEITVKSRYIAPCIWRRPELTVATFRPDPDGGDARVWRTGDLGRLRPDGALEHLGRKDFQAKIRGHRVEIGEVETALLAAPGVADACVVAGDDRRGEKRLVAYVVPVGGRTPTVSALRAHLSERLPDYATPAVFQLLDALPVNPNGKVDRLNLPTPDGGRPRVGSEYVAPRTEDERRLVAIWEDVLGVRPVGVRDDFVELGGDSLGAEAVFAAMEPAFGRSLPTSVMGECPTIERLAHAAARASSAAVSVIVPLQPAGVKPPLFCVHGLDGDVVIFDQLARHLAPDRPVIGVRAPDPAAEPEAFESCEALAARYVAAVRARRPAGPYHLAGYSLGATLALEMAQQLRRDGDAVGLLVSIDNPAPGSRYGKLRWTPGYFARAASRLPRLGRGLLALTREQRAAHLRSERRILATKFVHRFRSILRPLLEAPSAADWAARIIGPQVMSARVLRVAEHLQRILRSYEPRPYAGALAVLRARVQPLFTSGSANLEWDRLARGPLSADTVPGSHGSLLLEPHVRELARHLQQRLDEADPIP